MNRTTKTRNRRRIGKKIFGAVLGLVWFSQYAFAQDSSEEIQVLTIEVQEYSVQGFNPLSDRKTQSILKPYKGESLSIDAILDAASALEEKIHKEGYSLISVVVPEQPVSSKVITLETEGFTIENLVIEGNVHFSTENIQRTAKGLTVGEHPNIKRLQRAMSVANIHPAKRTSVSFLSQDNTGQSVDVKLTASDKSPHQFFTWLNDTGSESSGEYRLGIGYQHSNLFDKDHTATLTWTTSPDQVEDVRQIGLNYRIPVYSTGGFVDLLAFDSDIDTGLVAEVFNVSGRGETYRAGYTQLFSKRGNYSHQASFAVEDKLFDNEVTFEQEQLVPDVRSRPLVLSYQGKWDNAGKSVTNRLSYYSNLSGGSFNEDADYAASRFGAEQDWDLWRYSGSAQLPVKSTRLVGVARAQFTDEPLITGEQWGVGGQTSVRGFEERELLGDAGYFLSLQLWSPSWKNFDFLGFYDYGYVDRELPLPGEIDTESISSVGLGFRWKSTDAHWSIKVDFAHVLDGIDPVVDGSTDDGDNRIHFNILYRR